MKANDFIKLEGYWNGKLYSENRVFKNNVQYKIDDPENLNIPQKPEKRDFYDCLSDVAEKIDYLVEAYNSMSDEKRSLIRGSNKRSEIIGDPYQQRFRLNSYIETLQKLYKRIEAE